MKSLCYNSDEKTSKGAYCRLKRFVSTLLAVVILIGAIGLGTVPASAASSMTVSDACVNLLKEMEGFCEKPYWDYAQWTVGYGTRCPDDMLEYYKQHGITREEAEVLLRNFLNAFENDVTDHFINKYGLTLTQQQFDALILFSFNVGTGWVYESGGTFHNAIKNGATGNDLIRAFALWCSAGDGIKTFLLERRLSEANLYLNGVYNRVPPENYAWVIYDANGGYSSPRSQGYDADLTAAPYPVPTYSGYVFDGWYTAKNGGVKVTTLDKSVDERTLFAHWKDEHGKEPEVKPINVKITVTGSDVNLRQGPGTNYQRVGVAQKGDKLTITEVTSGSGYLWGKFDTDRWICLEYTNFDEVKNQAEKPAPEATKPEATKPAPTEPPATKPEATKPAPAAPKVTGTINVQEWLRVRSGPGTGYSVVEYLKPKQRVEILEQKTVGSMVWARISSGWISMDYVILDRNGSSSSAPSGGQGGTVVNCSELRIRSGPSTGYSVVGYLKPGTRVAITDKRKNGSMIWGKISNGWISLDYVQLDGEGGQSSQGVSGTVNVQEWLRIRTGPGTSYAVAGYMKPQERVKITERRTVGNTVWGKTSKGWISMDYVVLDGGSGSAPQHSQKPQKVVKTVVADCLCVRKNAGTSNSVVGYLYDGAKVEIFETKNVNGMTWGRISNGWISMDYVK